MRRGLRHVFVAATGAIRDDEFIGCHCRRDLDHVRDGVGGFERGDDAFRFGKCPERAERFVVGRVVVFDAC